MTDGFWWGTTRERILKKADRLGSIRCDAALFVLCKKGSTRMNGSSTVPAPNREWRGKRKSWAQDAKCIRAQPGKRKGVLKDDSLERFYARYLE